jgi:hypothetical protein
LYLFDLFLLSFDFQESLTRATDTIEKQARYIETLERLLLPLQKLNVEGSHDESERSIQNLNVERSIQNLNQYDQLEMISDVNSDSGCESMSVGLREKGLMTECTLTKSVSQRKYTSSVPPLDIGSFLHPIRLPTPHAHFRSLTARSKCQTHRLNKEPQQSSREARPPTLRNRPRGTQGENKTGTCKESWEGQYKMFIDKNEALGSDNRVKSSLHLLLLNRWRQVLQATRTDSKEHTHTSNSVRQQLKE